MRWWRRGAQHPPSSSCHTCRWAGGWTLDSGRAAVPSLALLPLHLGPRPGRSRRCRQQPVHRRQRLHSTSPPVHPLPSLEALLQLPLLSCAFPPLSVMSPSTSGTTPRNPPPCAGVVGHCALLAARHPVDAAGGPSGRLAAAAVCHRRRAGGGARPGGSRALRGHAGACVCWAGGWAGGRAEERGRGWAVCQPVWELAAWCVAIVRHSLSRAGPVRLASLASCPVLAGTPAARGSTHCLHHPPSPTQAGGVFEVPTPSLPQRTKFFQDISRVLALPPPPEALAAAAGEGEGAAAPPPPPLPKDPAAEAAEAAAQKEAEERAARQRCAPAWAGGGGAGPCSWAWVWGCMALWQPSCGRHATPGAAQPL